MEFATVVCDDARSATLDAGNVKLTYNALMEKVGEGVWGVRGRGTVGLVEEGVVVVGGEGVIEVMVENALLRHDKRHLSSLIDSCSSSLYFFLVCPTQ